MTSTVGYHVIRASGEVTSHRCELPDDPKKAWAVARAIVLDVIGPDNELEHVLVYWDGKYCDMFVDETGQLKELPRNNFATTIYRNNWLVHAPGAAGTDAEELPFIAGDAILWSERLWK